MAPPVAGNSTTSLWEEGERSGGAGPGQFLPFPPLPTPTTGNMFREGSQAEEEGTRNHGWRDAVGKGDPPQNAEKIDVGIVD